MSKHRIWNPCFSTYGFLLLLVSSFSTAADIAGNINNTATESIRSGKLIKDIATATESIRSHNFLLGASTLTHVLATLQHNPPLDPTLKSLALNNVAAAVLLVDSAHPLRQQFDPIQLLNDSTHAAPWCSAAVKNLRWALAIVPPAIHQQHYAQLSSDLELHSWRQAVFGFASATEKISPKILADMQNDGQTRHLNWCTEDTNSICHSSLGAALILSLDSNNKTKIRTNGDDPAQQCSLHQDLWINLFDDPTIPAHQHICHPPLTTRGTPMFTDSNYLDLLYRTLTGYVFRKTKHVVPVNNGIKKRAFKWSLSYGSVFGESAWLAAASTASPDSVASGATPSFSFHSPPVPSPSSPPSPPSPMDDVALTGIQLGALVMIDFFVQEIVQHDILGDLVDCGVWRGGSSLAMAASLQERDPLESTRKVWLYDSFEGVPPPSDSSPEIDEVKTWQPNRYAASLSDVQEKFYRLGLAAPHVVKGNFEDTMNRNHARRRLPRLISLLRIDVDSYEATLLVLKTMYSLVASGGFIVVDDGHLNGCKQAILDFRTHLNVTLEPLYLTPIDHINTCDRLRVDQKMGETNSGLNELLLGGDVAETFRCGPQVVYWRKE